MLTRLELIGFKSFADRTRFDFAPGVTAVVGPNGSGKSNIVDAVKWLVGEQSAKSLRGGEMTDVIFNGSTTRKSLGLAEVTMTFDNRRRELAADADEVQVTRRVYRDGQGEYVVNGQPARLKDVKELFLGSGAGHGAYSVIEQGRVDALLAASPVDRRSIFEEAAGVSRFRAKKVETLRKLERVDGDLTRVRDILAELDKQLRTLRLAAAKAQRHAEYTARLKELRVGLAAREFRELSGALLAEERALAEVRAELGGVTAATATGEAELAALDTGVARIADALRTEDAALALARQQIATHAATAKAERTQTAEAEAELLRLGKQRVELGYRAKAVEAEQARTAAALAAATEEADAGQATADAAAAAASAAVAAIAELTRRAQADRDEQFSVMHRSSKLHSDASARKAVADRLGHELARKRTEWTKTAAKHDALAAALEELSRSDADVKQRLAAARDRHDTLSHQQAKHRRSADALQPALDADRETRSALRGRADVLEGLERSQEGFGAGVRAVIAMLAKLPDVAGPVADLLVAPREIAPLIDVALGEVAQRFVVRTDTAVSATLAAVGALPGRVGFVPLTPPPPRPMLPTDVPHWPAADHVTCDRPELTHLPRVLLGHVVIVEDLPAARRLRSHFPAGRFVTRFGELLEPDGTLVVGPPSAEVGLLSRKSELRELHARVATLDTRIAASDAEQASLRAKADALDAPLRTLDAEIDTLAGEAGSVRDQILERRQEQARLADAVSLLQMEADQLSQDHARATAEWTTLRGDAEQADRDADALKARLAELETSLASAAAERDRTQSAHTAAQVAVAGARERLASLRKKRDELDAELKRRRIDGVNLTNGETVARKKLFASRLASLRASAGIAAACHAKEHGERAVAALTAEQVAARASLEVTRAKVEQARAARGDRHAAAHARELAAQSLRDRRAAVAARIRDDYAVELAELPDDLPVPLTVEASPAAEIDDLRKKLTKLGSVNLEALDELAQVEGREKDLRTQHDDLADARGKLQEILDRINADSRRLFTETLTTVRGHFQELFRKLFAGGQADIVLEEGVDVLDSGIEIVARPPGKEPQRLTLLSGGEKALTAVALLLAIFRSKPSPFCILDEVDAAMDEANTHRLATMLRAFADRSQFIVITHKKRTMAAADVLLGVTMQESGVSKPVAVRFEDWPDDDRVAAAA